MKHLTIALLLLLLPYPAWAQRVDHTISGKVVRVSDPQITPDGRAVAILVARANYSDNRWDAEVVVVDAATRAQRVIATGKRAISAPRWSADGSRLAYLAQVDGTAQVFVVNASGSESRQVTTSPTPVLNYAWRPDGAAVAYTAVDQPEKKEGEESFNKSFEITRSSFLTTDVPRPVHLWVAALDGSPARRLTSGLWTLPAPFPPGPPPPAPSWSPDGKLIAFVKINSVHSGERGLSTIQLLDIESGTIRPLTTRTVGEQHPAFSPDGKSLAYWHNRPPSGNAMWVAPVSGGFGEVATPSLDRNILRGIWTPDAKALLVAANEHATTALWIDPLDAEPRRIDMGSLVASASYGLDASISRDGRIAVIASEPRRPAELYVLADSSAAPQRLTDFNAHIAALQLGKTETIEWEGPDGHAQDGVITYPPDYQAGRKYPLVLYIHGGPRSTSKQAFSTRAQLLAAQGWIVFEPNYRGSDNHGGRFMNAIQNDAGAGPGRDVMSGVEQLKVKGIIDEQRMAVSGWSYGGFMTTWLIGNYPGVFRAAVAGAPVTDGLAQYTLSDGNASRAAAIGGSPFTNPDRMQAMAAQSPLTYASKVKTPTLIMALTGDYRVPIPQAYAYYHALRDNGVTVKFVGYPLPGHSPTDPVHQRDVDRRWIEWIATHLAVSTTDPSQR